MDSVYEQEEKKTQQQLAHMGQSRDLNGEHSIKTWVRICKSTSWGSSGSAERSHVAPCEGGAWGLACLSLHLSAQTLTLGTVRTVDSKLQ